MDINLYRGMLAIRGVAAIVFGILAVLWPGVTVLALALLFGAYALVDGVGMLIASVRRRADRRQRVAYLLSGLLGLVVGLVTLFWPGITALVLVVWIGVWALVTGLLDIWAAARRRRHWLVAVVGVLSILAGLLVLVRPGVGALAIAQVIGVYAIISGVLMLAQTWRLRRSPRPRTAPGRPAPAGA
jgi:uncharacterized membrane protein HdeD (DUF308 family)